MRAAHRDYPNRAGSWFSTALLGAIFYQLGTYAFRFRHDRKTFKLVVGVLTLLNFAHTVVLCQWEVNTLMYASVHRTR